MANPLLIKNFTAEGTIAAKRIVKHGSADGTVVAGAAATDALIGVLDQPKGVVSADRADVVMAGIADVEFGGAVARGDPLTSDSVGRAVAAAPASGANNRIVGFAVISGVLGDIGQVHLAPGEIQGA